MAVKTYQATVEWVRDETPSVYTLRLKLPANHGFSFTPGQYIMLRLEQDGKKLNKPYSIASYPSQLPYLDLCIKRVETGFVSQYLYSRKPGDQVMFLGPMGVFVLRQPIDRDLLFLAGGSGIGPLRCMIHEIFKQGTDKNIWLFFGNKREEEIIYREEFEALAREHKNFHFIPVLSKEQWKGEHGYIQNVWPKYVPAVSDKESYICGLTKLVEGNKALLLEKGMPKAFVHHEIYV